MEHGGNLSLNSYMKIQPGRRLNEKEGKRLFRQIVEGINYCHNINIVHRDIKLDNVLINEEKNIKIIDFGFAICISPDQKLKIFCGTPSYMSPEIVSKQEYCGKPADVWSLGIVLYTMLNGKFPFTGFNDKDLYRKIKKGLYDAPTHLSSDCLSLISSLLQVDPQSRPTTEQILLHSWLAEKSK